MNYNLFPTYRRSYPPYLFMKVYKNSAKLFYAINIFRWQIINSSIDTYTIRQIFAPAVLSNFPFAIPLTIIPLKGHKTQNSHLKKRSVVGFGSPHYNVYIFIYMQYIYKLKQKSYFMVNSLLLSMYRCIINVYILIKISILLI